MGLVIREVSDEDISRACEIELSAYKNSPLGPILAPGPFPPDSQQRRVEELVNTRKDDPSVTYLQVFDEEAGTMVAFVKWHTFETSEAAAASSRPLSIGDGRNKEACMLLYGGLKEKKKEIMGNKPHMCMSYSTAFPHWPC